MSGGESAPFFNNGVILQSWRLASAVARRHPELIVYEMHPGGGTYDVLCVAHPDQLSQAPAPMRPKAMLNRAGTIQVHDGGEVASPWPGITDLERIQTLVRELEEATGWSPPPSTPPATPRTLTYRFMAASLELLAFDRERWDWRSGFFDTAEEAEGRRYLEDFPTALEEARTSPRLGIYGEPQSHFWALMRGDDVVAVVSINGKFHQRSGTPTSLTTAYVKNGRRIRRLTAKLLAQWL